LATVAAQYKDDLFFLFVFATMVVKEVWLHKKVKRLLWRTMRNLIGRDFVPVFSVSDSLVCAMTSEERLLER
jgi:hypothetical protein